MKVYLDKMEPRLRALEERALTHANVAFGVEGEVPQPVSDPAADKIADRILSSNGLLGK